MFSQRRLETEERELLRNEESPTPEEFAECHDEKCISEAPPPPPSFRSTTVKETHSGCLSTPFVGHWEIHERLFWCQPEEQFIIREQIIHSVGMESLITLNRSEWQCWRYLGRIFSTHHQTLNPLTEKNMKLRSLLSFLQCFIYFLHKWDEKVRQIEPKCCSCWSTAHSYS